MTESLGTSVLTLKTDSAQYNAGIDAAEKRAGGLRDRFSETTKTLLGLGKDGKVSLDTLSSAFTNPTAGAQALGAQLGGSVVAGLGATAVAAIAAIGVVVGVGAALTKAAFDAAAVGAALDDASEITGISVKRLSGLKFAAEVTGGSLDQLTTSIFKMQQRMEENPTDFEQGLRRVGLTSRELEGLTLDEKFLKVNQAFRETKPGADQAAAAIALFGKQGREMIPLLNEDIKGLVDRSRELGTTWSEEDAKAAEDLERASGELGQIWSNLWTGIGNFFIPALHAVVTTGVNVVASLRNMYESVRLLWGEVRNVPDEIKQPKMWQDLAKRGVKPVALSMEEAAKVAKDMEAAIAETHKKDKQRAEERKKRLDEENKIRAKAIEDEQRQARELRTHQNKLSDERAAAEMQALADEYIDREKAAADLAEADRRALDGMYQERFRLEQEDAEKAKAAHAEKVRVFQETWNHISAAMSTNLSGMLTGQIGFKDGLMNIWGSIKQGVGNILNEMLGNVVDGFLKGAIAHISGAEGGFTKAFSGATSGFGGVLKGLSGNVMSAVTGWVGIATAAFAGIKALWDSGFGRGGEEGVKVNPARDAWFGGREVQDIGNELAAKGIDGETARQMIARVFQSSTMKDFTGATEAIDRILKNGLAKGGIVTRPMLSLIGERGPEAVIPLDRARQPPLHVHVTLNGREIARALVPELPHAVSAYI